MHELKPAIMNFVVFVLIISYKILEFFVLFS